MSIRNLLNTEGTNIHKITGDKLAIDVAGSITKSITLDGSLLLTGAGGPSVTPTLEEVLIAGNDCNNQNIINANSVSAKQLNLYGSVSGVLSVIPSAVAGNNTLTLPAGTTNFASTGGPSQVVKQNAVGSAFTVGQLAPSDLNGTVGVDKGGTGLSTITANGLLKGNGIGAMGIIAPGSVGHVLTMAPAGPVWQAGGGGGGGVTSVELTAPNGNAILSGTNPITTSGTINIDVGTKIDYDPVKQNLHISPAVYPSGNLSNTHNTVISEIGAPNLDGGYNVVIGDRAGNSLTTGNNNILLGSTVPANPSAIQCVCIGSNQLNTWDQSNASNICIGYGICSQCQPGIVCSENILIGKSVGANALITPGSNMSGCIAIGNNSADSDSRSYNECILIGNQSNTGANVVNAIALGANSIVNFDHTCQIGLTAVGMGINTSSLSVGQPIPLPASDEGVYLFSQKNGGGDLLGINTTNTSQTGTFCTYRNNYTCGTAAISFTTTTTTINTPVVTLDSIIMLTKNAKNGNFIGNNADTTIYVENIIPNTSFDVVSNLPASGTGLIFDWFIAGSVGGIVF